MARIPDVTARRHLMGHVERHSSLLAMRQREIASGQRIHKPSDDLFDSSRAMSVMSEKRRTDGFLRATESTKFLAATLENGVTGVVDLVSKARSLAVRAASDAADAGTEALAEEVNAVLEEMLEVGNRRALDSYVFAGEASDTEPFTATRDAAGDITAVISAPGIDQALRRLVGRNEVEVPVTGASLFQEGGDAFQTLIDLRDAILANDHDAIDTAITGLAAIEENGGNQLAALGTFRNRVDTAVVQLDDELIGLEQERSRAMDTDMAEAMVQLSSEEFFYQAALSMSARVSNLSLLNFL